MSPTEAAATSLAASGTQSPADQRIRWLPVIGVALASAVLGIPRTFGQVAETDAGWHLAIGRLVTESGIPFENALSWNSRHTYFYATSWLYDLMSWEVISRFGVIGLQILHFAIWVLALLFLAVAAWQAGRAWGLGSVPIAAGFLAPSLTFRPELVTWATMALVLVVGTWGRRFGIRARLLGVVVVALAGNFHSGAVYAAGYLFCFAIEAWWTTRRPLELVVGFAGFLALAANPGGAFNLIYLAKCLVTSPPVRVVEMSSAWEMPGIGPSVIAAAAVAVILAVRYRRQDPTPALLGAAFGILAVRTIRLAPELQLALVPLVARSISELSNAIRPRLLAPALGIGILAIAQYMGDLDLFAETNYAASFDQDLMPVRASAFLSANHLVTGGFNSMEEGGFLEYAVPGFQAFMDGRALAYEPYFLQDGQAAETHPARFGAFLDHYGAEWAVMNRSDYISVVPALLGSPNWALVYWDPSDAVFARRGLSTYAALIENMEYLWIRPDRSPEYVLNHAGTPDQQARALSEIRRYVTSSPGYFTPTGVLCVLESRWKQPEAAADCDHARALATSEKNTRWLDELLGASAEQLGTIEPGSNIGRASFGSGDGGGLADTIRDAGGVP